MKNLLLVTCLFLTLNTHAQTDLIPYRERDKWGYCDKVGTVIIKPIYQETWPFEKGLAMVKINGKFGLIDKKGAEVAPAKYDEISTFSENRAKVMIADRFTYIDRKGKEIAEAAFKTAEDFQEGLAFVRKDKWMVIDSTGKLAFEKWFTAYSKYTEGGESYGWLRYKFSEGLAKILTDSAYIYINRKGELAFPSAFGAATSFRDGIAVVRDFETGPVGIIDRTGKLIIPFEYQHFGYLREGLIAARKDSKWGYIDAQGKKVIDFIYESAEDFENGLARVKKEEGQGYIDKTGKEVIPCKYNFIGPFRDGVAAARDYYYGYLKPDNTWAIKDNKDFASPFTEGIGCVQANKFSMGGNKPEIDHKWGYMNAKDEWVVRPKYEKAYPFKDGIAKVMLNGWWGYIGKDGKEYFKQGRYDTVTVSNGEELVAAISSDRCIKLKPGTYELYDLEALKAMWEKGKESHNLYIAPGITYSSGWGITLVNLHNIAFVGTGKKPSDTRLLMKDKSDHIITFSGCRNMTIQNLEAGHTEGAGGGCDAGVLLFADSSKGFTIRNTVLFGSGTIGLNGYVSDLNCDSMTIKECSHGIISLEEPGKNLRFNACSFINNKSFYGGAYFDFGKYDNLTFTNCIVSGNIIDDKYGKPGPIFKFKDATNVTITNCVIENNHATGLWDNEAVVKQSGVKASGNSYTNPK